MSEKSKAKKLHRQYLKRVKTGRERPSSEILADLEHAEWVEEEEKLTDEQVMRLNRGETVQFRPRGNSMSPKINNGDKVTVSPCLEEDLSKGDIVFCKVKGRKYVHLIEAITEKMGGRRFQIGNNKKHTNGTIGFNNIFGKVTKVEK